MQQLPKQINHIKSKVLKIQKPQSDCLFDGTHNLAVESLKSHLQKANERVAQQKQIVEDTALKVVLILEETVMSLFN